MVAREQRLVEALVYMADTLVKDFDLLDLFYHLVESVPQLVKVDQTGLLLADPKGELQVVAASNETARMLDLLQVHAKEGPCHDAYRSGNPVMASLTDPAAAKRWPNVVGPARQAGFASIFALPMRLRDEVLGTLNLFRTQEGDLSGEDMVAVKALADMATIAILQERAAHDSATLVGQLEKALESRVIIEQAKGIVAQREGVDMAEAFARLRRHARDNNQALRRVAGDVVSGALDPGRLPRH